MAREPAAPLRYERGAGNRRSLLATNVNLPALLAILIFEAICLGALIGDHLTSVYFTGTAEIDVAPRRPGIACEAASAANSSPAPDKKALQSYHVTRLNSDPLIEIALTELLAEDGDVTWWRLRRARSLVTVSAASSPSNVKLTYVDTDPRRAFHGTRMIVARYAMAHNQSSGQSVQGRLSAVNISVWPNVGSGQKSLIPALVGGALCPVLVLLSMVGIRRMLHRLGFSPRSFGRVQESKKFPWYRTAVVQSAEHSGVLDALAIPRNESVPRTGGRMD